jgi:hypothetical protein
MIEAFPNVFVFDGVSRFAPGFAFGKTMTVVRSGTELTVINSAKLDDDGERALRSLGTVKHLVRLGSSHGLDDGWFIDKFAPTTWAPPRVKPRAHGAAQHVLDDGAALSMINARAFVFRDGQEGEGALLLSSSGGVLVTCDSLQAHSDRRGMTFLGGAMAKRMGFFAHPVVVGPIWLKRMGASALRADFARLCALSFTHLLGGHGTPLKDRAHDEVSAAVERTVG